MRYRLHAEVEGNLQLAQSVTIAGFDEILFEYISNRGHLAAIAVSVSVPAHEFAARLEPTGGDPPWAVNLSVNPGTRAQLLGELQAVESHLAFSTAGALAFIDWNNVTEERIPENDEDRALVDVPSFRLQMDRPRPSVEITVEMLRDITVATRTHTHLVVPKAFWREAMNEFTLSHFIQAFYNFFFILEDAYAPGKSGTVPVTNAFLAAANLVTATEGAIAFARSAENHWARLERFCSEEKCDTDVAGMLKMLVRVRGRLHHYSGRGPGKKGTPFTQADFESVAWFSMSLATNTIVRRDGGLPHIMPQPAS